MEEPAFGRAATLAAANIVHLTATPTAQPPDEEDLAEPQNGATIVARALAGMTSTAQAPAPTRTHTPRPTRTLSAQAQACHNAGGYARALDGLIARRKALIDEWNA
ncbi:MAG: hypothetical protein ACYC5M_17295 [Anaerolineae bacterium]